MINEFDILVTDGFGKFVIAINKCLHTCAVGSAGVLVGHPLDTIKVRHNVYRSYLIEVETKI